MARPRVLTVFPDHPWPPDMGSRVRNLNILRALASEFELTIVTLIHDRARLADPGPLAELGHHVPVLASHRRSPADWLAWHLRARLAAWREGLHPETFFQSLPALSREVERRLEADRPVLVHAAYWYGLRRLRPFPRPPIWVVDTHDVQFERHRRLLGRDSVRERQQELSELGRYDRIVAITRRDRETFRAALPAGSPEIEVIGMGCDPEHWRPEGVVPALPAAPRLAFYGNLATEANQEGARHLMGELLPGVAKAVPAVEAILIGGGVPTELAAEAARAGVRVTGFVEDPRPWLRSASVLALSLRSGSGQRGRVIEVVALGVPVIGYPEALEGLELASGEGILVAQDPAEFRRLLVRLLQNPDEARELGERGRLAVGERYGWSGTYGRFPELYRRLLGRGA